ncbi:glycerol-3-phosphate dehydrogenase [Bartonella tamiae]|uniref:Glycerol-3-phosphate dehydrogenase n=1 Tax=Bartonella tamiae Th239 TaxID=1094558 RepID=J1K141_9HYPH|nr:glycerol-3-phosphate dehydrogenase [Bartonella tamiae]EJF90770.1 hypothetical protein ME5_00638 [Bartonella tamiae Th239]EJF93413.1 hypothetical protein MEG_01244 [Bartonella tamiae Th307]
MDYEIFIIGGGVNGCGLARDAAGRKFKVGLAEMNDVASATSSASTKLIHGGLRYLEHYAFKLVSHALKEREILWRIAPHIVHPIRFLLPHHKGLRPAWLLRTGLFLYDHIGGRKELPTTRTINFHDVYGEPLKDIYKKGFEYSDAQVDDSRLVILNARSASELGATIMTRTEVISLKRHTDHWLITLKNKRTDQIFTVTSAFIANMAGPWINYIMQDVYSSDQHPPIRLVKGSHIVVKKLYDHDRAYIFQNSDGRIIFAIPYHHDFTLIGTTDLDYKDDISNIEISDQEISYIIDAANEYFKKPITREEIIWSYAGVRPLYDDDASKAQEATRDYVLKLIDDDTLAPMLNAYGGKITTYRKLAEDAMNFVEDHFGKREPSWTAKEPLPGGNFPHNDIEEVKKGIAVNVPTLDAFTIRRVAENYGTQAILIFKNNAENFGQNFGHGLYQIEVDWLIKEEWALTAEDILWRRTKLGLWFNKKEIKKLDEYVNNIVKDDNNLKDKDKNL